jgi:hypothetical protein
MGSEGVHVMAGRGAGERFPGIQPRRPPSRRSGCSRTGASDPGRVRRPTFAPWRQGRRAVAILPRGGGSMTTFAVKTVPGPASAAPPNGPHDRRADPFGQGEAAGGGPLSRRLLDPGLQEDRPGRRRIEGNVATGAFTAAGDVDEFAFHGPIISQEAA